MRSKDISILIVDDNLHFIRRMANLFGEVNNRIQIYSAGSYEEALKQLDTRKHDTVLLDINLRIYPARSDFCKPNPLSTPTSHYHSQ